MARRLPMGEPGLAQCLLAVLIGPPLANPALAQRKAPGHLFGDRLLAALFPVPATHDQCNRATAPALHLVLVELHQLDLLLHPTRRPRGPLPRRLDPFAQPARGVQLNLRIENRREPVQIPLVKGPYELPHRINHQLREIQIRGRTTGDVEKVKRNPYRDRPLRTVALLVLLPTSTPTRIITTDFVVLVLDHGLDPVGPAAVTNAARRTDRFGSRDGFRSAPGGDLP